MKRMLPTILEARMNNVMFYQKRFAVASFGVLDESWKSRPVSPGQLAPQAPALSEY